MTLVLRPATPADVFHLEKWDREPHVIAATSDTTQTTAVGVGPFAGLGPYSLSPSYSNLSDRLLPDASAGVAFNGSVGSAAVAKDTGLYRTSYWGFGLEAITGAANRQDALATMLDWCSSLDSVDGDADGAVNGADCAPADETLFAQPSSITDLTVETATLSWSPPAEPGADSLAYDLLRFEAADAAASAGCLESGDFDTSAVDSDLPAPGSLYYYLVRAVNDCGQTLGNDSFDIARLGASCP